ncbi:MAG: hypothetical protein ACTSQZ_07115 [Candidatus Thorarchaeota archaeon]
MTTEKIATGTTTMVFYPIIGALRAVEEFINNEDWKPINDEQREFLEQFQTPCRSEISLISEIECIADKDVQVINDWLKHHGFFFFFFPMTDSALGTASKLDLEGYWKNLGTKATLYTEEGETYPGIKMADGYFKFYCLDGLKELVIELETEKGDLAYMLMAEEVPEGFSLVKHVEIIIQQMKPCTPDYNGLMFPMIDLDTEGSLDWLVKMEIGALFIGQALQQTKLKMNEKGFRIKSAAAIQMILKAPLGERKEPYIINRPFLFWVKRPEISRPLFVSYLNKDVWKDPDGLDM